MEKKSYDKIMQTIYSRKKSPLTDWPESLEDFKFVIFCKIITNERSELSSYNQSYMGRLDDIQTA